MASNKPATYAQEYAESIIDTVREPLVVLDHDLRVVSASRSFYEVFKVKPKETVGQLIYDLGDKQWDIPRLRELLETILPQKATFDDYEVEHEFLGIGRRTMLLNARRIPRPPEKPKVILLAIEDVTQRRNMEKSVLGLAAIVNTSIDGIIGKTLQGNVISWNEGAEKIYGYTEKEMQGHNISLLAPPGYKEEILQQLKRLHNGELIKNHETKRVRKDGMIIDISLTLSPIKDKTGKICGVSAIMHDITEQKKARQVRLVSEYSESIINTVREPLIVLDQDLRVVSVSRSFYDVFKVKPEETVGQLIYDLGNKQWNIPKLRELLEKILPEKASFDNYVVEHDFATIGKRIMLLNARQIQRVLGKKRIILLAIEDITDRRKLEEAHSTLAAIVESADDAIKGEDLMGTITSWNKGSEKLYGYPAQDIVGKSISLLMPPGRLEESKEVLSKIVRGETIKHYETQRKKKDGQIIDVSLSISPVKDISGKIIGASTIARDITERKEIEAGLEKTRKELAVIKKVADEASEFAESIIDTVREPLLSLDQDLRVVTASRSFYEFFKVKPEETVGQLIYDLGNKQWNIPKLRELLETILPQKASFNNYEVEHVFATIGRRTMLLNARQIEQAMGKERIILLAIEDITERKEIEAGLEKTHKELEATKVSEHESREYSESIIDTVREPLIALDQNLRVVTASHSFYEVFKVNPKETVGHLIYDLGNKQWNIPKLRELLEDILPKKAAFNNYEVEHNFATIGRRVMLLNARQIQRASGKERIILLAIEDITARKEIEAGLEKTRKELAVIKKTADGVSEFAQGIIDTVREPLLSLDQDLRVVTASRSFYEFFKVKPEETVGQLIYDLGNKQWNIPKLRELLETILPQKAAFDNYEVEHVFATIGRRVMLLNARQMEQALGKERIILLAIEDITERKEIEAGLEKTRKELAVIKQTADEVSEFAESIINTVREPLLSLDQDLRVVSVSQSFYEFFKVKPADTVGQLIYDLGNKQWDIPQLRELLETILPQKASFNNYEVEHNFATIGRRTMLLNARQIQRASGKERIILLAIEDITARKEIEAGLVKAHEELSDLAIELKRVARAKSEFLANMSHELRTPLNSINGFSEVLYDETFGPLNEKQKKYVTNVLTSGKHLLLLINQILDMAKVESGKMKLSLSTISPKSLLDEISLLVADMVNKRKLELQMEIAGDLPEIEADELKVKEIIYNLISNAVKFTPEGGKIGIRANKVGPEIEIVVWDTGIGIAPENMEKLFEGFFRVDTPYSRVTEGTGLGLPISKKLVELHGGELTVESAGLDQGTSIRLTLPLVAREGGVQ